MKTLTKIILAVFFLFSVFCSLLSVANAEIPHLINYQGRLTDSTGKPLEGVYNLTFRIHDAENTGVLLWEEAYSGIVIQKGIFSVLLGSLTNLDLPFDKSYWLEIKVNNEVMNPRQRITSAAYAVRAESAEKIKATSTDITPGYLDEKIKNSITIDNNRIQLAGDNVNPGNFKYYGTDLSGVKSFYSLPLSIPSNIQVFTYSGTWIRPPGVSKVWVRVWGAGGAGALGSNGYGGGGGGGGGYAEGLINVSSDVTVTVGIGGGSGGSNGDNGGNSSFAGDTIIQGNGGAGGYGPNGAGGTGGAASGGAVNITGGSGQNGGGNGSYGGDGGIGGASFGSAGGGGGNGSNYPSSTSAGNYGQQGIMPGAGGGGGGYTSNGSGSGGTGANGMVIVYY